MANLDTERLVQVACENLDGWEIPDEPGADAVRTYLASLGTSVGNALIRWQAEAVLRNVQVNGVRASGGQVIGPDIQGLIRAGAQPGWGQFTDPISVGLRTQMQRFGRDLRVPNLIWYPSFAYVHGPEAPPTMNLPCPLASLAADARRHLEPSAMLATIREEFGDEPPQGAQALAVSLVAGLEVVLPVWLETTRVTQVVAAGPVPSFNPPDVPAGPVMGGTAAMRRGGGFF